MYDRPRGVVGARAGYRSVVPGPEKDGAQTWDPIALYLLRGGISHHFILEPVKAVNGRRNGDAMVLHTFQSQVFFRQLLWKYTFLPSSVKKWQVLSTNSFNQLMYVTYSDTKEVTVRRKHLVMTSMNAHVQSKLIKAYLSVRCWSWEISRWSHHSPWGPIHSCLGWSARFAAGCQSGTASGHHTLGTLLPNASGP